MAPREKWRYIITMVANDLSQYDQSERINVNGGAKIDNCFLGESKNVNLGASHDRHAKGNR
jgi:hypothetical protein